MAEDEEVRTEQLWVAELQLWGSPPPVAPPWDDAGRPVAASSAPPSRAVATRRRRPRPPRLRARRPPPAARPALTVVQHTPKRAPRMPPPPPQLDLSGSELAEAIGASIEEEHVSGEAAPFSPSLVRCCRDCRSRASAPLVCLYCLWILPTPRRTRQCLASLPPPPAQVASALGRLGREAGHRREAQQELLSPEGRSQIPHPTWVLPPSPGRCEGASGRPVHACCLHLGRQRPTRCMTTPSASPLPPH